MKAHMTIFYEILTETSDTPIYPPTQSPTHPWFVEGAARSTVTMSGANAMARSSSSERQ